MKPINETPISSDAAYQKASIYYYDDQQKFFRLAFTITAVGAAALFVLFLVSGDMIAAMIAVGKS